MPDRNPGEERRLRDIEAEAQADREAAGRRLVEARSLTRAADAAARRRERT